MTVVRVNSNLASATEAVAFAFGPFRLIPGRHVLVRENRAVKLGSRALDILHLLVIRAGQEVSKNELIEFALTCRSGVILGIEPHHARG